MGIALDEFQRQIEFIAVSAVAGTGFNEFFERMAALKSQAVADYADALQQRQLRQQRALQRRQQKTQRKQAAVQSMQTK